jgi:hypothetical protein
MYSEEYRCAETCGALAQLVDIGSLRFSSPVARLRPPFAAFQTRPSHNAILAAWLRRNMRLCDFCSMKPAWLISHNF